MACLIETKSWQIAEFTMVGLVIVTTSFFLVSIFRNWKKVQESFVNLYATNVLVIAVILSLVSIVNTANRWGFGIEKDLHNTSEANMTLKGQPAEYFGAFTTGLYFSLILIKSLGILLLAYGARHSYLAQRIGKVLLVPPLGQRTEKNTRCAIQDIWNREKCRATVLIMISWITPLGFAIAVPAGWKCATIQRCFTTNETFQSGCSFLWSPLKNAFIITISIAWAIGYAVAFGILIFTAKQHFRVLKNAPLNRGVKMTFISLGTSFKGSVLLTGLSFVAFLPQVLLSLVDPLWDTGWTVGTSAMPDVAVTALEISALATHLYLLPQPLLALIYFSGIKASVMNTLGGSPCMQRSNTDRRSADIPPSPDVRIGHEEEMLLVNLDFVKSGPAEGTPEEEKQQAFSE